MNTLSITQILVLAGFGICVLGILLRLREIMNRPFKKDLSVSRGSSRRGILFAFTLGMAPWEKESTRLHWLAYLRGIFFHVGIFAAFGVLLLSPWLVNLPQPLLWLLAIITVLGAVFGFAGIAMRLAGENERALSLPDDYFSVFLTAAFIALAATALFLPQALPVFYLITAVMLVYIPISKIRHCVYFFYSKFFFGAGFGHRGVIGDSKNQFQEKTS
jgi:hypothetical protein